MKLLSKLMLLPWLVWAAQSAANVSDKLMTKWLNQQVPAILHQQKNQPFQLGSYDITVHKAKAATLVSRASSWQLNQPIRVEFVAHISQNILGASLEFQCATEFASQSVWRITPNLEQGTAAIAVTMPIPETELNCDGLKLPITTVLQQWFQREKNTWQQQAEQHYQQAMKKVF